MATIYIDFDKTISPVHGYKDPKPGAIRAIKKLYQSGHKIVIFTCRANPDICGPDEINLLKNYLAIHSIPYHEINRSKPLYDILIDDRTLNPLNLSWDEIHTKIESSSF